MAITTWQRTNFVGDCLGRIAAPRQIHGEGSALAQFGGNVDRDPSARHDAMHERQTRAGANTNLLGREERVEHVLEHILLDAGTGIADLEHYVAPRFDGAESDVPRRP